MQRAFGGTNQNLKTVNIKIDPGQVRSLQIGALSSRAALHGCVAHLPLI